MKIRYRCEKHIGNELVNETLTRKFLIEYVDISEDVLYGVCEELNDDPEEAYVVYGLSLDMDYGFYSLDISKFVNLVKSLFNDDPEDISNDFKSLSDSLNEKRLEGFTLYSGKLELESTNKKGDNDE